MKNVLVILMICMLVSVSQAEFLVNGGFETGDFTGWTYSGSGTPQNYVATSQSSDGYLVTPHSGNWMMANQLTGNYDNYSQDVGTPIQGTFTGWFNRTNLTASFDRFMAMYLNTGDADNTRCMIDLGYTPNNNYVQLRGWGNDISPVTFVSSYTPVMGQWHEIKVVVDDNGLDAYFDNQVIVEDWADMTAIQVVGTENGWGGHNGGMDDFSLTPEPISLTLLGLGGLALLRRKRA